MPVRYRLKNRASCIITQMCEGFIRASSVQQWPCKFQVCGISCHAGLKKIWDSKYQAMFDEKSRQHHASANWSFHEWGCSCAIGDVTCYCQRCLGHTSWQPLQRSGSKCWRFRWCRICLASELQVNIQSAWVIMSLWQTAKDDFKVTSLLLAPYASPSLARFRPWRLGTRKKKRNHCVRSTPAKLQIPPLTWHRPMPSLIAGWASLISPTMASAAKASGIWFTTAVNSHPFRLVYRARTLAASLPELMLACSLLASQGRACCNSYLVSIQDNPIRATSEHLPQTTGPIDPSTHKTGWRRASTAGPFGSSHAGP